MSERFTNSPIRLRPEGGRSVSIEVGGEALQADVEEPSGERVPVPPPKEPPWRAKLRRRGELLDELQISGGGAEELAAALAEHGDVDAVHVEVPASSLTPKELAPLTRLSRLHGVAIDVDLDADG